MPTEATLKSYISKSLNIVDNASSFAAACRTAPSFYDILSHHLEQQGLLYTMHPNIDKPFAELQVELIEEKWQETFWWGQSYLSIKISKLAPVFICEKVMIQLDHSVEGTALNAWQYLAGEMETKIMSLVNNVAAIADYGRLTSELSVEIDTGALTLNAHYQKWKPTIYALFFEKITRE